MTQTLSNAIPISVGCPDAAARRVVARVGLALFLTMLPVTMMVPVLKELVADRFAASSFWTHSFMSINMVGAVLAAPLAGFLADRVGRRKPLLVFALLLNSGLLWLMLYVQTLGGLLAIRFLEGAAHILAVSSMMALAGDWAAAGKRGRVMGWIGSSLIFGTACGAPLGGRIGQITPHLVFQLGAAFALAAALLAWFGVRDAPARARTAHLRESLSLISRNKSLLIPLAYAFIDRFCVGVIVSSLVLYLAQVEAFSPAQRGGLLALFLFPFALLCYPMGRWSDRIGRAAPMCIGSLAFGIVFALYGFTPGVWLWVLMLLSGVLSAIMFAPNLALCADLAPPKQRASVYAGFNMAGSLGFLCGPLIGGVVLAVVTPRAGIAAAYRTAFVVAGLAEVVCALVTLPFLVRLARTAREGRSLS